MVIVEYSSRDKELVNKIKAISSDAKPEDCYTCVKCTNGCPASKVFPDFAPHKFQIAAMMGLIDDIIESGILWKCYNCFTCGTRCPMNTAPAFTIASLTNIAVSRGIAPPKAMTTMIQAIKSNGAIQEPLEVPTTDFDFISRDDLNLPPIGIKDKAKFQAALKLIGADQVLEIKASEEEK